MEGTILNFNDRLPHCTSVDDDEKILLFEKI